MPGRTKEQEEAKVFMPEISTELVHWFKTEMTSVLKTKVVQGEEARQHGYEDGKKHTVPLVTRQAEFVFPVIRVALVNSLEQVAQAAQDILAANQPGYTTPKAVAEYLTYGLYNAARARIGKGADIKLTASQQNALKMFGEMLQKGLIERHIAVECLLKQGIEDAESAVDQFLADSTAAQSQNGTESA